MIFKAAIDEFESLDEWENETGPEITFLTDKI